MADLDLKDESLEVDDFEKFFNESVDETNGVATVNAAGATEEKPVIEKKEKDHPSGDKGITEKSPKKPDANVDEDKKNVDWEQKYKSTAGRLKKLQLDNKKKANDIVIPENYETAEINENLQKDVDEFSSANPQFKHLIEQDNDDGEVLRSMLEEYGPEITTIKAENIVSKEQSASDIKELRSDLESDSFFRSMDVIAKKHPEVADMMLTAQADPANEDNNKKFNAISGDIMDWIESKPYKEATAMQSVFDNGSGEQISELLTNYNNSVQSQSDTDKDTKPDISAGLAVKNTKVSTFIKPGAGEEDFESAFEEAVKERTEKDR